MEHLGTSFGGAWTNDSSYFNRVEKKNSIFHQPILNVNGVCWFDIGTSIEGVPLNANSPFYDFYVYNGVEKNCKLYDTTDLNVFVNTAHFCENKWELVHTQKFVEMVNTEPTKDVIVRHHIARLDLSQFVDKDQTE